ncbi:YpzG family protein [Bacillus sp. FJAT-29790]|uniref:YpzG family protein n=1 Tax=Bacillus sp. FJAT-29790 TaxID=1895002 RepID=UPI001C221F8B|nr:YpzG family protein [Bacillus sp. FJAT-29790]MBU8880594.1 YpzG family protein [Bacillus sp. FJAT-29790]
MGKSKNRNFERNPYSRSLASPWANPKHAYKQVNGQTQQTQDLIILETVVKRTP